MRMRYLLVVPTKKGLRTLWKGRSQINAGNVATRLAQEQERDIICIREQADAKSGLIKIDHMFTSTWEGYTASRGTDQDSMRGINTPGFESVPHYIQRRGITDSEEMLP